MTVGAQRSLLADGRWHFQHGPIDILIEAHGEPAALAQAHETSWRRFEGILDELAGELAQIRQPVASGATRAQCDLHGLVARRMWLACQPYCSDFITPMAAVAGSVADELIDYYRDPLISRAWINNGGDIALHLAPNAAMRVGVCADIARAAATSEQVWDDVLVIGSADRIGGIATSGWRGRSFSLGIADSVTVLAGTAAMADAAATMIANEVDSDAPGITRARADSLCDASDLGGRLVTVDVPRLSSEQVARALESGFACAGKLQARGLISAAGLYLQGQKRVVMPAHPGAQPIAAPRTAAALGTRATRALHAQEERA